MENSIRAFIAIELDKDITDAIDLIQKNLKKSGADVKWVKPKNIHLTLKFLGQTPIDKIDQIAQVIKSATESQSPFSIELTNIGAFPKIEKPKVIWLGMESGKQQTTQIASDLEEKLEEIGFEKEDRSFNAHITIGRVRSSLNRLTLSKALRAFTLTQNLNQTVQNISLIKSTLTPQGPIYEIIKTLELNKDLK